MPYLPENQGNKEWKKQGNQEARRQGFIQATILWLLLTLSQARYFIAAYYFRSIIEHGYNNQQQCGTFPCFVNPRQFVGPHYNFGSQLDSNPDAV